jgi:hypothetical protein
MTSFASERQVTLMLPILALRIVLGSVALTQTGDLSWTTVKWIVVLAAIPLSWLPRDDTILNEVDPLTLIQFIPWSFFCHQIHTSAKDLVLVFFVVVVVVLFISATKSTRQPRTWYWFSL